MQVAEVITRGALVAGAAVSIAVALGASAAPAQAGQYTVWTCRGPSGQALPTTGWAANVVNGRRDGGNISTDACASRVGLVMKIAALSDQPHPILGTWTYTAPESTTVTRAAVTYGGYAHPFTNGGHGDLTVNHDAQNDPDYLERFQGSGRVGIHELIAAIPQRKSIRVAAGCFDPGGTFCAKYPNGRAVVQITRGIFTLEDRDAPVVTPATGDAVTNAEWGGPTGIAFGATDRGGGVYRLLVQVDGKVLYKQPLSTGSCRALPRSGSEYAFGASQPCPLDVGGLHTIDADRLPPGRHTVRVAIEDAGGNQATVLGPTTKTIVANGGRGEANGSPPSSAADLQVRWRGKNRTKRTVRFGDVSTMEGRLVTSGGQPIAGARIDVFHTHDAKNAQRSARTPLRTNAKGEFRAKLPRTVGSRKVELEYRTYERDAVPVVSKALYLRVKAAATLRLSPRRARAGRTTRLSGRLRGGPVPSRGKVVELQARDRGGRKWITFRTLRTSRKGAFSGRYRFRLGGPVSYRMRVRIRPSQDYPYRLGYSPTRSIRVR